AEAPGIVLGICRFHRNGNGWNDIGYNFLVDRFGDVYAGRSGGVRKAVVGAHAQGFNSQTTGVASIGTHTNDPITDAAEDAFVDVIAWKLALHGTKAGGRTRLVSGGGSVNKFPSGKKVRVTRVFGHGRVNETACPGGRLKKALERIARRAQARIESSGADDETEDGGAP
ncbi:MAG TPA: N-acetylmuramoyl-L-alanine amidase, partial [Solirubrobacterales bacterium]|nr:N-acetylmuramoyl-L-alanine amidase [Solirubrobacterales bacterium]